VRQIDFIDNRDDFQIGVDRRVGIGNGLGFNPLKGVGQQQGTFAAGEAARYFVMKVDVAGSIDEIEFVFLPLVGIAHGHRTGFDCDPSLAFQSEVVQQLVLHLPLLNRSGKFKKPVGEGALAVVDVGNDAKVANVFAIQFSHRSRSVCKWYESSLIRWLQA
jgi:hypothetical protein